MGTIEKIKKRGDEVVKFDKEKIVNAIFNAAQAVGGEDRALAEKLAGQVVEALEDETPKATIPTVEGVQDIVERVLIKNSHYKTAKAYILYREQHKKIRETKDTFVEVENTIKEYIDMTDWRVKENSNEAFSFSGLLLHTAGKVMSNYNLNYIYTPAIREAHKKGYFHIHDLSHGVIGYCSGWSLKNLLLRGFGGIPNKVDCKPAKHLSTVVHQMVNYIGCLQMEFAGAQAFSISRDETVIVKDNKGNIVVTRVGEFCDKFIEGNSKRWAGPNGIEFADISDMGYEALSFDSNGKSYWKPIKKAIRHPITDPLHLIRTNKGIVSASRSHSLFSLNTHQYLGMKENLLLESMKNNGQKLFSYELGERAKSLGIKAPEKAIQKLVAKGLLDSELMTYKGESRHFSKYTVKKNEKHFTLKKTKDLNKFSKEVKTNETSTNNIATLVKITLPNKNRLDLYKYIKDMNLSENIDIVLDKQQSEKLKNEIQKTISLRKFSFKLRKHEKYMSHILKKGKIPFWIYDELSIDVGNIRLGIKGNNSSIPNIFDKKNLKNFIKLIAWYITEGWKVNKYSIGISQKGNYVREIANIIKKLNSNYFVRKHETGKIEFIINGIIPAIIVKSCDSYAKNKKIPEFVYNLNNELKKMFLKEMVKGDGYKREKDLAIVSTSNKLITGLNLIAISLDYRTSIKTRHLDSFGKEKIEGRRLTRYDLILHHKQCPCVLGHNDFESAVVSDNYEVVLDSNYEYDLSVEGTESFVGGVGLFAMHNSSVDSLLAPFVKTGNLDYKKVKQNMQQLVFSLNIPSRWGTQFPFSNLTFDWVVPEDMKDEKTIVGGKQQDFTYGDCQKEIDMINRAFLEVMLEGDANGRVFTFPIPTYNITKDFDWGSENAKLLFSATAKYGMPYFQNYVGSDLDPKSIRAMCCRLNIDLKELQNRPGHIFAAGDNTGSLGVVTLNMNRLGYEAKSKEEFFEKIRHYMNLAKESLEIKRRVVSRNLENGLMPYTKVYLGNFNNHFSTIGLCGMNEACMNLIGKDISSPEGKELTIDTLNFMRDEVRNIQQETKTLYNLEATPAESTSYRFAMLDKKFHPDIITAGKEQPFLTNSTQLPVDYGDDIVAALEHQNDIQHLYTGGTIFHMFLGEKMDGWESCMNLVKKVANNTRIPYFSVTPTFSVCPVHGYVKGEHFKCPVTNGGGE